MQVLTRENYTLAIQFMKERARKLERSIYEYEFEHQPFSAVLEKLAAYQNSDGGFGHGLEPDLRCEASSALATTRALEILGLCPAESVEMARKALSYLASTFRPELSGWDMIPLIAEQSPRAIWWKYGVFRDNWGNPNADIAGYFMDYRDVHPYERLDELVAFAIRYLHEQCDLTEMHELFCYLHFAERLDGGQQAQIAERLEVFLDNCISLNLEERSGYGATPLQVVDSPRATYYEKYKQLIPAELDSLIQEQTEEGAWEPSWLWHQYEDVWLAAKEEWKGVITLQALRTLRNFDRIE